MIEICNLREKQPSKPFDVRVDRKSVLGNPHYMTNESKRDEVCERYKYWFESLLDEWRNPSLCAVVKGKKQFEELCRLVELYKKYGKLRLFYWCAPKRCHAEIIRDYIFSVTMKENNV